MHSEVIEAIQRYVDGCKAADPEAVRGAFAADAVMWGYLGEEYVTMSGADFAANVIAGADPAGHAYAAEIHSVVVTGGIAHAILDERGFLGADFRNHFGLVRRDGVWRIASKVFTTV